METIETLETMSLNSDRFSTLQKIWSASSKVVKFFFQNQTVSLSSKESIFTLHARCGPGNQQQQQQQTPEGHAWNSWPLDVMDGIDLKKENAIPFFLLAYVEHLNKTPTGRAIIREAVRKFFCMKLEN